jgi:transcriptional regulator with XRE-family HTH domain
VRTAFWGLLGERNDMDEELIAQNIKALRKQKKITLEKLAELTGLTKGYISKVERSRKAPPYSTLNKIAIALGVDAAFLLGERLDPSKDTRVSFTKKNQGRVVGMMKSLSEGSLYGYGYEALAVDKPGKNMEPYIIEPAFGEEAIFQHEGEEFMYVLEGKHEFIYDGNRHVMEKGDSVYFDATVPHTGRSLGKKKAKLLAVMYNYKRL